MKNIVIGIAVASLCVSSARATIDPGAPAGPDPFQITLLDDSYGEPAIEHWTTQLPETVQPGYLVLLENGPSQDRANWSDVLVFYNGPGVNPIVPFTGFVDLYSDDPLNWSDITFNPALPLLFMPEATSGQFTTYRAYNSSGQFNEYDIESVSEVPEPTTMLAGALLLLPFGASTLRILRKTRTA